MARSADPEREIWGTWEELLLACAVNRHGTGSWDSVAMEVQARSPFSHLLTPQSCRQRYRDLQRRFAFAAGVDGGDEDGPAEAGDASAAAAVPWLEELRNLRVAELRREVERYDLSIVTLQLKVKRLKEEREQSLRETESDGREEDPEDEEKKESESPGSTPGSSAGDRISGGDSGRSSKESNSTNPKEEGKPSGEDGKPEEDPGSGGGEADPAAGGGEKVAGEGSYHGSSDTIAKGAAASAAAGAEVDLQRPQMGESGESVAESKGGEAETEGEKESSDVQSSASPSRRRRKASGSGGGGGDEQEADEDFLIAKRIATESQPLVSFLEIIRSHKYGSIFERRLESQESDRYRSVIRQHVDLEMVRAKLECGGGKAYANVEFFRDLLLLCNNAIVFYPRESPEATAAVHLRQLVSKEIAATIWKLARPPPAAVESAPAPAPAPSPPPPPPPQPKQVVPKLKKDPDLAGSLLEKPSSSAPIIACRKRSSISTKVKKEERDEKHDSDRKERESEEQNLSARRSNNTKERSATRGLRTNKSRGGNRAGVGGGSAVGKGPNSALAPSHKSKSAESTAVETAVKTDKKSGGGAAAASMEKKRSAASFLNRMKRSSPSSNGSLLETLKGSTSGGSGRGAEQKKAGKGDGRKDQGSRQGGSATYAKKAPEPSVPGKRSVGRPPKRAAAPPTPPPAKKAREEAEAAPAKPPTASSRKRARR